MKARKVLLFLVAVVAVLATLCAFFPSKGVKLGTVTLRMPTLSDVMHRAEGVSVEQLTATDSLTSALNSLADSVAFYRRLVDSSDLRFWLPSKHYFDDFFHEASHAKADGRTLRVLHYGDSQIEMDHITSRLRARFQARFGGGGPGMVPFCTVTPSFSVSQSNAGAALVHLASFGDSTAVRSRNNYGPMMQCFRLDGGEASATFRPSRQSSVDACVKRFSSVTLLFDNRSGLAASVAGESHRAPGGIGSLHWQLPDGAARVHLSVSGSADLYAVLLDDGPGVAVDNIPMRGCSGQQFTSVSQPRLAAANGQMDIGLIILQFGGNSVPYFKSAKAISTYCQSIGKQIEHVRASCPGAAILFIGPSDMSTRIDGRYQTYPLLPDLVDSLAATATAHGVAYWSIFHAMGGVGSMPQWVRQGYAGKDYIHFSQKGADLMGDLLSEAFDNYARLQSLSSRYDDQQRAARARQKNVKHRKRHRR